MTNSAAYKTAHSEFNTSRSGEYQEGLVFGIHLFVPIIIGLKLYSQSMYNNFVDGNDSSSLISICSFLDPAYFDRLLNEGEAYKGESINRVATGIEKDKTITELYKAIFNNQSFPVLNQFRVGRLTFHKDVKNELLKISNLFSIHASLD